MFTYLLQGITLGFYAGVSPGPFQAYLLSRTLENGWKRTILAAFAPLLSDGPIIFLVLVILSQTPDWLLRYIRLAGGVFILYLAWGAFRSFRDSPADFQPPSEGGKQSLLEATMMNALNPNPYIFWSTILGPIAIEGWRISPGVGIGFVLGFYATMVAILISLIMLFATARHLGPNVRRALSGASVVALFGFGVYMLFP